MSASLTSNNKILFKAFGVYFYAVNPLKAVVFHPLVVLYAVFAFFYQPGLSELAGAATAVITNALTQASVGDDQRGFKVHLARNGVLMLVVSLIAITYIVVSFLLTR